MSEDQPQKIDNKPSKDERTWVMLSHFSTHAGCVFLPFGHILAPLIIWLRKREDYTLVAD